MRKRPKSTEFVAEVRKAYGTRCCHTMIWTCSSLARWHNISYQAMNDILFGKGHYRHRECPVPPCLTKYQVREKREREKKEAENQ